MALLTLIVSLLTLILCFNFQTLLRQKLKDTCSNLQSEIGTTQRLSASDFYFSGDTLQLDESPKRILFRWYSRNLEAMEEPSFRSLLTKEVTAYRLLWLRSFHPSVSIRVWECKGNYYINVKQLDSIERYIDGEFIHSAKIEVNNTRPITYEQWMEFISLVNKSDFWLMPTNDGKPAIKDGSRWMLEGVKDNKHHVVNRQSPENGDYREACLYLIKLSGLKIDELY